MEEGYKITINRWINQARKIKVGSHWRSSQTGRRKIKAIKISKPKERKYFKTWSQLA